MKTLSIGKLSAATDVNIETIRYYERKGILPRAQRSGNGRRLYSEEDVKRLTFISRCRKLGFSLKEIMGLLSLVGTGEFSCREIHDLILMHAEDVRRKIEDLRRIEDVLKEMAAQCNKGAIPDCPIVDSLYGHP